VKLATRHRVALLYLRAPSDPPLDTTLQERCELVEEVMRPDPGFSLAEGWSRLNSLLRGRPLWAAGSSVAAYGARLRALARTWPAGACAFRAAHANCADPARDGASGTSAQPPWALAAEPALRRKLRASAERGRRRASHQRDLSASAGALPGTGPAHRRRTAG